MTIDAVRYLVLFTSLGLLMLMQIGFLCLESGIVRSKNSINVAAKNIMDLILATLLFWLVGYSLMFGSSYFGLWGEAKPLTIDQTDNFLPLFFLFQAMFAATAITIVSGAIAERCTLLGYIAIVVIMSIVIYPVVGHWAWGGVYAGKAAGWLEVAGFYDFAGSTVVHITGGAVALAAVLIMGPRIGRFDNPANNDGFNGSSMVTAVLGVFFLWLGWFGFNGGSTVLIGLNQLPIVLMNTAMAGAAGGAGVLLMELFRSQKVDILKVANGLLAGLVGVTAGCNIVTVSDSVIIGLIAGILVLLFTSLLNKLKIDDPVGAIPVHLGAGLWGTLAVPLFVRGEFIPDMLTRFDWFQVQLQGAFAVLAWSFLASWLLLKIFNYFVPLRVNEEAEESGLNVSEHGAKTELYDLLQDMKQQELSGNFASSVHVEPCTEIGRVAFQYNQVTSSFNEAQNELQRTITNLKQTRRALNEARKKAETANTLKSEFLANMSHEIRTPINGVIGMAELLLTEDMPPKQQQYLNTIHSSAKGLVHIINDILDYSKIEAGEMTLECIEFNLEEVLHECLDIFVIQASEKHLTLTVNLNPDTPRRLFGDPTRIRQIIINLMSNAFKFTETGEITLNAGVMTDDKNRQPQLKLTVTDTGIGMTEEQCQHIFQAFKQADATTTRQYGGTGLGLSITRELVRMMDGEINVTSQPEKGTCFELTIATQIADKQTAQITSDENEIEKNRGPAKKKKQQREVTCQHVIVAEDNKVNQMVIRKYLEKLGIKATILENGQLTVDYCKKQTPDLILMDCEMPVMDGLTATRQIRSQNHQQQPIIIGLSAHAMKDHQQKGLDNGMDFYLTKPVTLDQLKSAILQFFPGLPEH